MQNWNCDGSGPHCGPEVRVLRIGATADQGNMILCRNCFNREIDFRVERNRELAKDCAFQLPAWDSLEVYK